MKKIIGILFLAPITLSAAQYGRDVSQMMSLQATSNAVAGANSAATPTSAPLPVPVRDSTIEKDIRAGNYATTVNDLERCRMIYPNGSMTWGKPDVGNTADMTCLAEVYMKTPPAGGRVGSPNDRVLAVAYVAAGGAIKCNISEFPANGYQPAAGEVTFPSDNPPTLQDVESAMNNEQKSNAPAKIISAAIVGGLGTYLATKDSGNQNQALMATAAGAVGMGGLAAVGTQTGKVAGDTIMSVGMNGAAGALVGNMAAGMGSGGYGDNSTLVVKDCIDPESKMPNGKRCLWGYVMVGGTRFNGDSYYNRNNNTVVVCTGLNCKPIYNFYNIKVYEEDTSNEKIISDIDWNKLYAGKDSSSNKSYFCIDEKDNTWTMKSGDKAKDCPSNNFWVRISSGFYGGQPRNAMIENFNENIFGAGKDPENAFGATMNDFNSFKKNNAGQEIVWRKDDGTNSGIATEYGADTKITLDKFLPMEISAQDGNIIDFDNKARMSDTIAGAAGGAAMGGLASYQGAKSEIEQRLIVEQSNYEGSLKSFYCITGNRYLGRYNDPIVIPVLPAQ